MSENKMYFFIAKLLLDYSYNGKLINQSYINKLIEIVVKGKSLEDYVHNFVVAESSEDKSDYANYRPDSKTISLYLDGFSEYIESEIKYIALFPKSDRCLYKNLITTQTILHELEHAEQQKIIDTSDTLEASILRLCEFEDRPDIEILVSLGKISINEANSYLNKKYTNYQRIYNELYLYAPHERLAEIKSYQTIINILKYIKYTQRLVNYEKLNKLEKLLRGYNSTYSPTITYLEKQDRRNDLEKFDWYSESKAETIRLSKEKYSLSDRLKYGLPIDKEEHRYMKQIYMKSIS